MTLRVWRLKPLLTALFLISLLLTLLVGRPAMAILSAPTTAEIRGVWITTNDTDVVIDRTKLATAIEDLARLNFNTVYPVVWNAGYALFPSGTAQRANIQPFVREGIQGYDILAELASDAHQKGLSVIPWFEFGFMAPPTSELAMNHPSWLTRHHDGSQTAVGVAGEVAWLNPFHPEVQQFLTNLVLELISRYDVDGVQFDDHFSLPVEFGYDAYTTALYEAETGRSAPEDPHNPHWVSWRADKLTAFVESLHAAVKARRPRAVFSIAPNPYHYAYNAQLQDWRTWVQSDLVDELIVQVYRDSLYAFREQIFKPEIAEAQRKIPTAAGILSGLRNAPVTMSFIEEQVLAARSAGLGCAFFFYESLWDLSPEPVADRQAGFQALFPRPLLRASS